MSVTPFLYRRRIMKIRKWVWRVFHPRVADTRPIFILGVQRSGTTMLTGCFEKSSEFDVYREISDAMVNFRLKEDNLVRQMIQKSHHRFVVFKPLTDSHRANDFLGFAPTSYVIWMFRRVEDRANSAVVKSGSHNLAVLQGIADGTGLDRWQALGLTGEIRELVASYDYSSMSTHDAAALLWYVRNSLFFSQGLDNRPNVLPLAYEDLVSDPERVMRGVCSFLGATFLPKMVSDVHARSVGKRASEISESMAEKGERLYDALHRIQDSRLCD